MRPTFSALLAAALSAFCLSAPASVPFRLEQRVSVPPEENLGWVAAVDGDWAALGSGNLPLPVQGRVVMCRRQAGVWQVTQVLEPVVPEMGRYFGRQLALHGQWLMVRDNDSVTLREGRTSVSGAVHVYHLTEGRWTLTQTLRPGLNETEDGLYDFAQQMAVDGDRLVATLDHYPGYPEPGGTVTSLLSYRLRAGAWVLEEVLPEKITRAEGLGAPVLDLEAGWLAVGDYGAVSSEWQAAGAVHLFRQEAGAGWRRVQTLRPPVEKPAVYFGVTLGLAAGGERLLVSSQNGTSLNGIYASQWDGRQWSAPAPVEAAGANEDVPLSQRSLPVVAVAGEVAAVKAGGLHLLRWSDGGWRRMRSLPVDGRVPALALAADTVVFPSEFQGRNAAWSAVSFLPVGDLEVRLARARTLGTQPGTRQEMAVVSAGQELPWQSALDGAEMPLVVVNASAGQIARPVAGLAGAGAALFDLVPQAVSSAPLAAGEEVLFSLRSRAGSEPVVATTVEVTFSTGGTVPDFTFQVMWNPPTADDGGTPELRLTAGEFWQLGRPVQLVPAVTGLTGTPACRWLRNGVVLADQTGPVLTLPEARPEDAGRYVLEMTLPGRLARSNACQVAVYDPQERQVALKDGEMTQLEARLWGSAQVDWLNPADYSDELMHPWLAGVKLPTLTVLDGRWIEASGVSDLEAYCTVVDEESGMQVAWKVISRHRLLSVGRKPGLIPVHGRFFAVGDWVISERMVEPVQARDLNGGRNAWPGSRITASGLPPGLRLLADGNVEGTFEKAGVYPVTWRVQDASGVWSEPVVSEFIVGQDEVATAAGQYAGGISGSGQVEALAFQGSLELRVELGGGFSGVLRVPGATRRFAGRLRELPEAEGTYEAQVPLKALPGVRKSQLRLTCTPASSPLNAEVLCALEDEGQEVLAATLRHRPRRPLPLARQLTGAYNILLGTPEGADERELPAGTGFMRVVVTAAHTAHVLGTLPDGTGCMGAGQVMPGDDGLKLVLFHENRPGCSLLGGEVTLDGPGGLLRATTALHWKKAASSTAALLPDGLDASLNGEGCRYLVPPRGLLLLSESPDKPGNALCQTDGLEDGLFRLTSSHRAVPHGSRSVTRLQRLDFYAPTGFFTGIVQVAQGARGARPASRSLPLRGLLLPPASQGGGLMLMPQPAAASTPGGGTQRSVPVRLYSNDPLYRH